MINEYYILRQGQNEGPYSHTELMDMGIQTTDFILSPIADGLQQAADLPEFQEYFKSIGMYIPSPTNVASFWWRLFAYFIDYALLYMGIILIAVIVGILSRFTSILPHHISNENALLALVTGMILYHSSFETTTMKGSIGKTICKLVVDAFGERLTFGRALSRNFSKILSGSLCGLGFLTVLWNPMRQGWHDQIAKTYIVRKS